MKPARGRGGGGTFGSKDRKVLDPPWNDAVSWGRTLSEDQQEEILEEIKRHDFLEFRLYYQDGTEWGDVCAEVMGVSKVTKHGRIVALYNPRGNSDELDAWLSQKIVDSSKNCSIHLCKGPEARCDGPGPKPDMAILHVDFWRIRPADDVYRPAFAKATGQFARGSASGRAEPAMLPARERDGTMDAVEEKRKAYSPGPAVRLKARPQTPERGRSEERSVPALRVGTPRRTKEEEPEEAAEAAAGATPKRSNPAEVLAQRAKTNAEKEDNKAKKRKQRKKKKAKKKKAKSESDSESASDSGSEDAPSDRERTSVFRLPRGQERGGASNWNRIQEMSRRHPGHLMQEAYDRFQQALNPSLRLAPGEKTPMKPCAIEYVRQIGALPQAGGRTMSVRDRRELDTAAYALDMLVQGKLSQAGDVLVQRMKAIETAAHAGNWKAAEQLELLPQQQGMITQEELDMASKQASKRLQVQRNLSGGSG